MIRAVRHPVFLLRETAAPRQRGWWDLPRSTGMAALLVAAAIATITITLAMFSTVSYAVLERAPGGVQLSVEDHSRDLPLEHLIKAAPAGWDTRVEDASLWTSSLDQPGTNKQVPIRLEQTDTGWLPGQNQALIRPEAKLAPDSSYHLVLRGSALQAQLPWPRRALFERQVSFSTPASPRPLELNEVTHLKWQAPLEVRWNMPVRDVQYQVEPPASVTYTRGPDGLTSYFALQDAKEAASYRLTIAGAVGPNGIELQVPRSYTLVTPTRPSVVGAEQGLVAEIGKPLPLRWNVPIDRLVYQIDSKPGAWKVHPQDPNVALLELTNLEQGGTYKVTISQAIAASGAPASGPRALTLRTPSALEVLELDTGPDPRAPTVVRPVIIFNEPVRDRAAAENSVRLEPPAPGRFEWLDDKQLRFVPSADLPFETRFTFKLLHGPERARSQAGGFLAEPVELAFRTVPNKTIDVDVTRQTMNLLEGDQVVRSMVVSTGLPGADTPLGEFRVRYKMPSARFRGVNSSTGQRYDLDNVRWVLAFQGDYTIHGAWWRQAFGRPGSNGCVSLTDENAKIVYDWAPEGTQIRIHY